MALIGTGSQVRFSVSGFTAEILSAQWSDISRDAINVDLMDAETWMRFIPADLVDSGEISIEVAFDPDQQPPVEDEPERIALRLPVTAGVTEISADGFVTSWSFRAPIEAKMTASVGCKMTGEIYTASTLLLMKNDDGDQAYNDDGSLAYVA